MTDTPLFDATAGDDADHVEALIRNRPPTAEQIIAEFPRETP